MECVRSAHESPRADGVVFMFPGGGSQHTNMARAVRQRWPAFCRELEACAARFRAHLDFDILDSIYPDDDRTSDDHTLTRPLVALPALFAIEYAVARLWMAWGVRPVAVIG
ncbi:MAG: acyltransferase domain-containing protein, partial [Acidobacteria bacterium]|nr:acyltransferase domain-containing protein [Acidobacteriota bacterium]